MKDAIILDCDEFILKKKKNKILSELSELDELDYEPTAVMISSQRPEKEKKHKSEAERMEEETSQDDWLATVANFKAEPIKRKSHTPSDIFNYYDKGKKKKKKKKKDGLTDFNKEFENEMNIIKELMVDQSKFTDSLQKKYDAMENMKSSARGVGKFTTDLIESINTGRSLSLQLVKEQAALKKTIADLTMKEKKEFGSNTGDTDDLGLYASSALKKMIAENAASQSDSDISVSDADINTLLDGINEQLVSEEGDSEIDKYLQYESSNVTVYACINQSNEEEYYFLAKDENGTELSDYPLPYVPESSQLTINRSTNVATDTYSRRYPIIWV